MTVLGFRRSELRPASALRFAQGKNAAATKKEAGKMPALRNGDVKSPLQGKKMPP